MKNIRYEGNVFSWEVYTSKLYRTKALHPKDGECGWAIVNNRDVCLIYNEAMNLWERPQERFQQPLVHPMLEHSVALM